MAPWIQKLDDRFRREKRHVLLLLDNFSAHLKGLEGLSLTNLKAYYRKQFLEFAMTRYEENPEANGTMVFNINQLKAMHMARSAWKSVTQQTISNCWKHTGIIPGPKDPIVEKQLAKSKSIAADKDLEDIVEKTKQSLDKPLSPSPFFSPTFASSSPLHPSLAFMHPSNVHPALG
ncbi:hypothetical protein Pst134EB_010760 [Puccinia striiformis f. sp. tritici]|nr:hypothetical protein Pst134EB_010760 [Puccinia striiformis f. sp. tritici]